MINCEHCSQSLVNLLAPLSNLLSAVTVNYLCIYFQNNITKYLQHQLTFQSALNQYIDFWRVQLKQSSLEHVFFCVDKKEMSISKLLSLHSLNQSKLFSSKPPSFFCSSICFTIYQLIIYAGYFNKSITIMITFFSKN